MFRVSPVLRRYDADVPPTAVGACCRRPKCTFKRVFYAVFCGGRTQWVVQSAAAAKDRIENAFEGTFWTSTHGALSDSTICNRKCTHYSCTTGQAEQPLLSYTLPRRTIRVCVCGAGFRSKFGSTHGRTREKKVCILHRHDHMHESL